MVDWAFSLVLCPGHLDGVEAWARSCVESEVDELMEDGRPVMAELPAQDEIEDRLEVRIDEGRSVCRVFDVSEDSSTGRDSI